MTGDPVASVLIPVHDAADTLAEQLDALVAQQGAPPFEVVVALNRCSDNSADVAKQFHGRLDLRVITADERPSAAHARNAAARAARGSHLLFCDADDRASGNWVQAMTAPLVGGRADIVGGRIVVDRRGLPNSIYRTRYRRFDGRCLHHAISSLYYCLSASMACTRVAFETIGGFDEAFLGAGAEEVDLASRMQRAGYRIGEVPEATLAYRPRTTLRGAHAQQRSYARGNMLLAAKEGRLLPRPSAPLVAKRMMTRMGWMVLKQHEFRPTALGLAAADTFVQHREIRRLRDAGAIERERTYDFPVPVATPGVGGLAFAVSAAAHATYVAKGVERHALTALHEWLPADGVFIDVGAQCGLFTVAAARRGATVIAFEADTAILPSLRTNLGRHRVLDRVTVRSEVPASGLHTAFSGPVDVIRIANGGGEAELLDSAGELLRYGPALLVRLHPDSLRARGRTVDDVLSQLPPDRWELHLVDEHRTPHVRAFDATTARWVRSAPVGWVGNLLAVPAVRGKRWRSHDGSS